INSDRTTYLESLKKAAEQHEKHGVSVRKAAANFGLSNSTLQRFLKQNEDGRANFGYQNCKTLAEHIRELDHQFHGLTARKCRALAYEFARRNHLEKTPKGWEENRMAGNISNDKSLGGKFVNNFKLLWNVSFFYVTSAAFGGSL
uniref:HTH psq-type domain-containing protein n=1 Tax=Neogobius melanostomus TaxID=47308 RepID=A0A8C6SD43_9GOBI